MDYHLKNEGGTKYECKDFPDIECHDVKDCQKYQKQIGDQCCGSKKIGKDPAKTMCILKAKSGTMAGKGNALTTYTCGDNSLMLLAGSASLLATLSLL